MSALSSLAVIACLSVARPAQAGSLSEQEKRAVSFIDQNSEEALELLERVVNMNSGTENFDGVRQVGEAFQKEFEALGFQTSWVDGAPFNRAGHLVADHPGPGPRILLIGHLDTVFPKAHGFQKFQRVDGGAARGPGIIDMKGGDVVILQAVKALAAAGALERMNIRVVMTGDEESPGTPLESARAILLENAKDAAVAIGFESGDGDPAHAVISRRGFTAWTLTVTGKGGHSSQVGGPDLGYGAIYETAHVLEEFRRRLSKEKHLTINPGLILGGTDVDFDGAGSKGSAFGKRNVVAKGATVIGDLRTFTPEQSQRAMTQMQAIAGEPLPNTQASLSFDQGYPPLAPTDGNSKLLSLYDGASRDLGFGAVTATSPDKAGAADVSFLSGLVPMVIDGVGMKGKGDHSDQETADLAALPMQTKRAAVMLLRLSKNLDTSNPSK